MGPGNRKDHYMVLTFFFFLLTFRQAYCFLPLVFVPLCPFTAGPSLRIRLLGGRTLERRKWCWSWTAGGEPRPAGFGCIPDGFGDESEASAAHGLGASSPSLFVLGCSLGVLSALSSSSQPSSFRMVLFEPSTPEPACWPTVILIKYTKQKESRRFLGRFAFNQNRGINLEEATFSSTQHGRRCLFQIPLSPSRQFASKNCILHTSSLNQTTPFRLNSDRFLH